MTDQQIIKFLIGIACYVVQLHERAQTPPEPQTNAGTRFHEDFSTINWEHEGFARWMGWRGEEEQEREIRNKRQET